MRSIFLAGFAVAALSAAAALPANADPLLSGGVAITNGGGNTNTSKGAFSMAGQGVTTLGGMASKHGTANTYGGGNTNTAYGRYSVAGQDVTTVGGMASGRGGHAGVARRRGDQTPLTGG